MFGRVHVSMTYVPLSVEQQLKESGFSGTEILVLRHLLAGCHCTVRELASKTGKSTGVVDQSIKKLLRKQLVQRQSVNGAPSYSLGSTKQLSVHLQQSVGAHIETLHRRAKDIDQYLASIELEHNKPTMEYFAGRKGMKALISRLIALSTDNSDIVAYIPTSQFIQEEYQQERDYFTQQRKGLGLHMRLLTHDTLLGKRLRELDPITSKETRFISSALCPLHVGHILAGAGYSCINYQKCEAYLVLFADFTAEKRAVFEGLWQLAQNNAQSINVPTNESLLQQQRFFSTYS